MKTNIFNKLKWAAALSCIVSLIGLASCTTDIDSVNNEIENKKLTLKLSVHTSSTDSSNTDTRVLDPDKTEIDNIILFLFRTDEQQEIIDVVEGVELEVIKNRGAKFYAEFDKDKLSGIESVKVAIVANSPTGITEIRELLNQGNIKSFNDWKNISEMQFNVKDYNEEINSPLSSVIETRVTEKMELSVTLYRPAAKLKVYIPQYPYGPQGSYIGFDLKEIYILGYTNIANILYGIHTHDGVTSNIPNPHLDNDNPNEFKTLAKTDIFTEIDNDGSDYKKQYTNSDFLVIPEQGNDLLVLIKGAFT